MFCAWCCVPLRVEVPELAQQAVGAAQQLRVRAARGRQRAQLGAQRAAHAERGARRHRAARRDLLLLTTGMLHILLFSYFF